MYVYSSNVYVRSGPNFSKLLVNCILKYIKNVMHSNLIPLYFYTYIVYKRKYCDGENIDLENLTDLQVLSTPEYEAFVCLCVCLYVLVYMDVHLASASTLIMESISPNKTTQAVSTGK
jgi:hypothetical protein